MIGGMDTADPSFLDLGELLSAEPPPKTPSVKKLNYSHEAMIDQIIANPGIKQDQLAEIFGYTAAWVSTIMASDAFQAQLETRREELVDPILRESVKARMEGLVHRSLEILAEKLSRPVEEISDQMALRSYEVATRAAGYGVKTQETTVKVDVNAHLESLSTNLVGLLRRKKGEVLEHDDGQAAEG